MIYDLLMHEMSSRYLYKFETYGPFFICSYAMHHMNLINRRTDDITDEKLAIFWSGGMVPDLRLHNLMIAPSGYMKTTFMDTMYDMLFDVGTPIIKKANMTEAAFVGTVKDNNGSPVKVMGIAEKHQDDVVMIGEFSAITNAMKANYNTNFSTQMLEVLDHGGVNKDLGPGGFSYDTRMTLWAGVQPSHYELSSGLGRRICPLIFLPTRADDAALHALKKARANIRKNYDEAAKLTENVQDWVKSLRTIKSIDLDDKIYDIHTQLGLFQFECEYFDRLCIGYHLAKYGASENVKVNLNDNELLRLIEIQRDWRRIIYEGIDSAMIIKIIKSLLQKNSDDYWLVDRRIVAKECEMVSWNKKDVYAKLKELAGDGHLTITGDVVRWLDKI